ncbi:hypothetical protein QN239_29305 [Mycolicibacterium sp. Y3]
MSSSIYYAGYEIPNASQELVNKLSGAVEASLKTGGTALFKSEVIVDMETGETTVYSFLVGPGIPILVRTTTEAPKEAI